jgi:hypothetical protein
MSTKAASTKAQQRRTPKRAKTILEGNPRKTFSKELYGYTRGKLRATRGSASDHRCSAKGCGAQAKYWIVGPDAVGPFYRDPFDLRFSGNLEDYTPRCRAHRKA